jgi:hypothetical protein
MIETDRDPPTISRREADRLLAGGDWLVHQFTEDGELRTLLRHQRHDAALEVARRGAERLARTPDATPAGPA